MSEKNRFDPRWSFLSFSSSLVLDESWSCRRCPCSDALWRKRDWEWEREREREFDASRLIFKKGSIVVFFFKEPRQQQQRSPFDIHAKRCHLFLSLSLSLSFSGPISRVFFNLIVKPVVGWSAATAASSTSSQASSVRKKVSANFIFRRTEKKLSVIPGWSFTSKGPEVWPPQTLT